MNLNIFLRKFNPHRNVHECVDICKVYSILNCNNLMEWTFKFTGKLRKTLLLYSQALQKRIYQEWKEPLSVSISKNKSYFWLFQANIYIITFGVFSFGDNITLETPQISFDLRRNSNGITVRWKSSVALSQLVLERLKKSSVKETFTPCLMIV